MKHRSVRSRHGWAGGSTSARRWIAAAGVVLMAGPTVAVAPAHAAPGTGGGQAPASVDVVRALPIAAKGAPRTITLITGDAVRVDGKRVAVMPGAGRRGIPMLTSEIRGHTFVVPADAEPLVQSGTLDRQLFDVTELLASGYDDAASKGIPLIVRYAAGERSATGRKALTSAGGRQGRTFRSIDATAVTQPKATTSTLWRTLAGSPTASRARSLAPAVRQVWLDRKATVSLDVSVPQIKAPAAWAAGYTGKGVKVAILDSGYDPTHPDLKDAVTASANFTTAADIVDHTGHGTHIASTIAGSGAASDGRYKGVAPGAQLIIGKVCPDRTCPTSAILQGMEWAAAQGAKVVSMSFGSIDFDFGTDPQKEAIERLTRDKGVLFVAAAGNDGVTRSVNSPGTAPSAISVASVDRGDRVSTFSSRGPTWRDALKPDVAAPGEEIVAAKAAGTDPSGDDPHYTTMSGTSMATPHVSGAAAIVLSRHPDWSPQQVKAALLASARPAGVKDPYAQGAGVIDVAKAIEQSVTTTPSTVDFKGTRADDGDRRQTVTYTNSGPQPVTLDLALDVTDPAGRPRPELFKLDTRLLTVPAGGSASATVTANLDGLSEVAVGGWITASAGGTALVRTPVGGVRTVPWHTVRLTMLDRTGSASDGTKVYLVNRDSGMARYLPFQEGVHEAYLPEGSYTLLASILTPGDTPAQRSLTVHTRANLQVRGDTTLTVDARQGEKLTIDPGAAGTEQYSTAMSLEMLTSDGGESMSVSAGSGPDEYARDLFVLPGDADDHLTVSTRSTLVRPVNGDVSKSPTVHHLLIEGHRLPGPAVTVDPATLAAVKARFAANAPDTPHQLTTYNYDAGSEGIDWGIIPSSLPVVSPLERTEYFTAAPVGWSQDLCLPPRPDEYESDECQLGAVYRRDAGSEGVERWNGGVFGPAAVKGYPATRKGGRMMMVVGMLSDSFADHAGIDRAGPTSNKVWLDGELLDSNDWLYPDLNVGTTSGTYRVETQVQRSAKEPQWPTSKNTIAWTFRSDYSEEEREIPILVVRFAPELDIYNRAPAGQAFTLPIRVQGGTGGQGATSVTVDASYDDGATWQSATVTGSGETFSARLTHPAEAGNVALRAKAVDREGNTVEQTIIGAYEIR